MARHISTEHIPRLREEIEIQTNTPTRVKGAKTDVWAAISDGETVGALVEYESTSESIRAGRPEGKVTIRVTMRDYPVVKSDYRIVWESNNWIVQGMPTFIDKRMRFQRFAATRTDAI